MTHISNVSISYIFARAASAESIGIHAQTFKTGGRDNQKLASRIQHFAHAKAEN